MFTWKSASEGREIQAVVEEFVEGLKKVGKIDTTTFSLLNPKTLEEINNSGKTVNTESSQEGVR